MSEDTKLNNFRVPYYDRVAHRGISAEKTLISILKDDKIDRDKLLEFCISCQLPEGYRMLIWKILLDILPVHQQSHKFVMSQRVEQYNDLYNALIVMRAVDRDTEMPLVFLKMFLLENGLLGIEDKQEDPLFVAVATTAAEIADSHTEAYWLSVKVFEFFDAHNFHTRATEFAEVIARNLEKTNPKLASRLSDLDLLTHLPPGWFRSGFSRVFTSSTGRIWNLLFGRASTVLAYVALQILVHFERRILSAATLADALQCFRDIPFDEETSDVVVSQAVEKWVKLEKTKH